MTRAQAWARLRWLRPLGVERVATAEAVGRVLARDVRATLDLPHFARSYMDGYAVRCRDTAGAGDATPARLRVIGTVEMGRPARLAVRAGEACRIPTGGMLPRGADAVVMVEHTAERGDGRVEVRHRAQRGEHVMRRGDDVRRGALVFGRGHRVRPQDVGALSGVGVSRAWVFRRPLVALIATGDEIVPPGVTPGLGQVRNVNQYALRALIAAAGGTTLDLGVLPDREEVIVAALRRALGEADAVLFSGGSSVGVKDLVPAVIARVTGTRTLVHGVRIKPGKPTVIARAGRTPIIGLPGNPTSALVIFELFAVPVIRRLGGEPAARAFAPRHWVPARLATDIPSKRGREDYVRVALEPTADGAFAARPLRGGSGEIVSFVRADGMVRVEAEHETLAAGTPVRVQLLTA